MSRSEGQMPCLTNGGPPLSVLTMRESNDWSSGHSPMYRQNKNPFIIGVAGLYEWAVVMHDPSVCSTLVSLLRAPEMADQLLGP